MFSDTVNNNQDDTVENSTSQESVQQSDCCAELEELKRQLLVSRADFENFKKRIQKEKQDWISSAHGQVIIDILSVIDDFDRAFHEYRKQEQVPEKDAWLKGFELIYASFYKLLDKYHVREIKEVQTFDPNLHEAVMQIDVPDHESGTIIQILQKGFMLNDVVLRPAKVSVAK
jgi:molecular chaperone GrpE